MTMNRRTYLKASLAGSAGFMLLPSFGCGSPNAVIQIGQIGCGRIARDHDLPEVLKHSDVRVVAVSDLDSRRMSEGRELVEQHYAEQGAPAHPVSMYQDYREMLSRTDIDAVVISTPDHQHFLPALEAAMAGKDIYLQKPFSLTLQEGRILSDVLRARGTVFQVGSQQRSVSPWPQFKRACELVRNGRLGRIHTVLVGLPGDPSGGDPTPMTVPAGFDYDAWLGSTPGVPYTVDRVHPQQGYGRGGWLRCEQFSPGMITGWGAHHVDTAHWGIGAELTGPVEITGSAEFPSEGLWDVHGAFEVDALYVSGVRMNISGAHPNGVRFEGEDGWVFVTRSGGVTASDPDSGQSQALQASSAEILDSVIGPEEIHLYESQEQHSNWIECIRTRGETVAPVEVAHRSTSACLIAHIAMKVPGTLHWDPEREEFRDNDAANALRARSQRPGYGMDRVTGLQEVLGA